MKNRILRKLKELFIILSICMTLLSGPVAGNEINKMLKSLDERKALIREINEAENDEAIGDKHKFTF